MKLGAVLERQDAIELAQIYRQWGRTVVLTNGCFDLLHVGHVRFLETARALGNVLIVGLNSDASVQRLKGPSRPIVGETERAELLVALISVDHVVIFEEDTAENLVRDLTPSLYVKGGEYDLGNLPEALLARQYGGQALLLPHTPDRSTTRIIQAIHLERHTA